MPLKQLANKPKASDFQSKSLGEHSPALLYISPLGQKQTHSVLRSQSDQRFRNHFKTRLRAKREMPVKLQHENEQLLQRKVISDAASRSCTEWEINHLLG